MIEKILNCVLILSLCAFSLMFGSYLYTSTKANIKATEYYIVHTHLILHQLIEETGCTIFNGEMLK